MSNMGKGNGFKERRKENESQEAVQESGGRRRKWRNGIRLRKYGDNNGQKASRLHFRGSECSNRSRVAMTNRQVP